MAAKKNYKLNRGQAIFELIIFIPLLLLFFQIVDSVGTSINASINQQKATRSYLFQHLKNNSYAAMRNIYSTGVDYANFGNMHFAWAGSVDGGSDPSNPSKVFASCFKLATLGKGDESKKNCKQEATEGGESYLVKIKTAFGVCGASMTSFSAGFFVESNAPYFCSSTQ